MIYTHIYAEGLIMDYRYKLVYRFDVEYHCHCAGFTWIACWIINTNYGKSVYDVTSVEIMTLLVVTTELLTILNFFLMSIPAWIVTDEHPSSAPTGSLSSSEQFNLATNESWKKEIIYIHQRWFPSEFFVIAINLIMWFHWHSLVSFNVDLDEIRYII